MPSDLVHIGKHGWLFLVGGTNHVLENYITEGAFSEADVQAWIELLRGRIEAARQLGARYAHLIAPEKLSVYPEYFEGELPFLSQVPAYRFPEDCAAAGIDDAIVDPLPVLRRYKPAFKLYWQTDTHWTPYGCFCAYEALCDKLAIPVDRSLLDELRPPGEILLDLGAKLEPPRPESWSMMGPLRSARRVAANPIVIYKEKYGRENDAGLHRGSSVVFVNDNPRAHPVRIVLFGDSFSEYRPHLLTGMLAETARELHFIWSLGIDWSYVERLRPDFVITEATERFMRVLPTDDFDVDEFAVRAIAPLIGP